MRRRHDADELEPVERRVEHALSELTDTTETAEDAWLRINERAAAYERRRRWWPFRSRVATPAGVRVWRLTSASLAVALTAVLVATFVVRPAGEDQDVAIAAGGPVRFANATLYAPSESTSTGPADTGLDTSTVVCASFHTEGGGLVCDDARGSVEATFEVQEGDQWAFGTVRTDVNAGYTNYSVESTTEFGDTPVTVDGVPGAASVYEEMGARAAEVTWVHEGGFATLQLRGADDLVSVDRATELASKLEPVRTVDTPVTFVVGRSASEARLDPDGEALAPGSSPQRGEVAGSEIGGQGGDGPAPVLSYELLVTPGPADRYCVAAAPDGVAFSACDGADPRVIAQNGPSLLGAGVLGVLEEDRQWVWGALPRGAQSVRLEPEGGAAIVRPAVGEELRAAGRFFVAEVPSGRVRVVALDADGGAIGDAGTIDEVDRSMTEGTRLSTRPTRFTGEEQTVASGQAGGGRWEYVVQPTDTGFCFGLALGDAEPSQCLSTSIVGSYAAPTGVAVEDSELGVVVGVAPADTEAVRLLRSTRAPEVVGTVAVEAIEEYVFFAATFDDAPLVAAQAVVDGEPSGAMSRLERSLVESMAEPPPA